VDDGRGGAAVGRETVQDALKVVHAAQVELEDIAVLARHAVALGDLGRVAGGLRHHAQPRAAGADPDQRADRVPERARIDLGLVGDHAGVLEPAEALGRGGRGQAHLPGQFADACPGAGLQGGEEGAVDLVHKN
jgi:hypothetical protein